MQASYPLFAPFCTLNKVIPEEIIMDYQITNWTVLDNEQKARFIFEECRRYWERIDGEIDSLRRRAGSLFQFLFVVMSGLIGYVVSQPGFDSPLTLCAAALACCVFVEAILCIYFCMLPGSYYYDGSTPEKLLRQEFCEQSLPLMIVAEAMKYEEAMETNRLLRRQISSWLERLLLAVIVSPIVAAVVAVVLV